MDVKEILLLLVKQQQLAELAGIVAHNLADVQTWIAKAPTFSSTVKEVKEWMELYPDWADKFKARADMLREADAVFNEEGFDRWTRSPEDGGIPF
jgi:hypothetical protein